MYRGDWTDSRRRESAGEENFDPNFRKVIWRVGQRSSQHSTRWGLRRARGKQSHSYLVTRKARDPSNHQTMDRRERETLKEQGANEEKKKCGTIPGNRKSEMGGLRSAPVH